MCLFIFGADCRQLSGLPFCPDLGTRMESLRCALRVGTGWRVRPHGPLPLCRKPPPPTPTYSETQAWLLSRRGPDWTPALPRPETPGKSHAFHALYGSVCEVPILCLQHTHNPAVQPTAPSHRTFLSPQRGPCAPFQAGAAPLPAVPADCACSRSSRQRTFAVCTLQAGLLRFAMSAQVSMLAFLYFWVCSTVWPVCHLLIHSFGNRHLHWFRFLAIMSKRP